MYHKYKNVERVKPSGLELVDRLVGVQRVTKVTKGGRAFGFSAIVVVGDGNGVVGHGLGKSKDVASAIAKGTLSMSASVFANRVLPVPVGPHKSILLFSILDGDEILL